MMPTVQDPTEARRVLSALRQMPSAPKDLAHAFNVATEGLLDALEKHYFREALAQGISTFKYVQGYYGSGKSQFIHSLAARAWRNMVATSIVQIGTDCPFNSPSAIYQAVMRHIKYPDRAAHEGRLAGLETLIDAWVDRQIAGATGYERTRRIETARRSVQRDLHRVRDTQMSIALRHLVMDKLDEIAGVTPSQRHMDLLAWVRGERVAAPRLKMLGLTKPVNDQNAANRLKTVLAFLRERLVLRGVMIAFDEGGRTGSIKKGSLKQRQAIENMLGMINDQAEGEYEGTIFLYAATPEFRNNVILNYEALQERIGSDAFNAGCPMVPLIDLDNLDTVELITKLGHRLLELAEVAYGIRWDWPVQAANIKTLVDAEHASFGLGPEIRRSFVFHFSTLLDLQRHAQSLLSMQDALGLINDNPAPEQRIQ